MVILGDLFLLRLPSGWFEGMNLRLVTVLLEFEVGSSVPRGDDRGLKGFSTPRWISRPGRVPRASCTYIAQETAAISDEE